MVGGRAGEENGPSTLKRGMRKKERGHFFWSEEGILKICKQKKTERSLEG